MMKAWLRSAFAAAFAVFAASASAQAIPAARRSAGEAHLGVAYGNANSDLVSQRIGGVSIYGTYKLLPHFALEGDVHLLQFLTPQDLGERSYLGGGRLFYHKQRYEPYVKFLGGLGSTRAQRPYITFRGTPDTYGIFAGGGGLDIYGPKHLVIRAFDYEMQVWPAFPNNDLTPSILTFGVAYRIK